VLNQKIAFIVLTLDGCSDRSLEIAENRSKMARMAWAVLTKGEAYRPPLLAQTAGA